MNDPTIIAASIAAVAAVVSALLSGITQHLFRKRQADQDSLRTELETAVRDIHFLLEVETHHCESNKQRGDDSNKLRILDRVQASTDLQWSGRFTPGRAKDLLHGNHAVPEHRQ